MPMRPFSKASHPFLQFAAAIIGVVLVLSVAHGATLAPPMLDISKQCELASGRNVTAMSECVVAESIARSELLRKWDKLADADVQICLKANRKAKHRPYAALGKCLSIATVGELKPAPIPANDAKP